MFLQYACHWSTLGERPEKTKEKILEKEKYIVCKGGQISNIKLMSTNFFM